jgi:hypothetical protein
MGKPSCNEVGDGDQMPGRAVTAGLGLRGLNLAVGGLDPGIGEPGIESIEDSFPVVFEALGNLLDGLDAATSCPAVPALEQRLGALSIGGGVEDFAQRLLDAESAVSLEVETSEFVELKNLARAPVVLVLQPDVAGAFEAGVVFDLLAADLVDSLVHQLDNMKLIKGDLSPGQLCVDTGTIAGGHIDADALDILCTTAMGLEIFAEGIDHLGFTALAGKQQSASVEIVKQADVVMPAPRGRLVQTDRGDLREVLLC